MFLECWRKLIPTLIIIARMKKYERCSADGKSTAQNCNINKGKLCKKLPHFHTRIDTKYVILDHYASRLHMKKWVLSCDIEKAPFLIATATTVLFPVWDLICLALSLKCQFELLIIFPCAGARQNSLMGIALKNEMVGNWKFFNCKASVQRKW